MKGMADYSSRGDPGGIRTHDPQLRRLLLYPAELPDHSVLYSHRESNPDLKFRKLPFYPLNYGSICLEDQERLELSSNDSARYRFMCKALTIMLLTFLCSTFRV